MAIAGVIGIIVFAICQATGWAICSFDITKPIHAKECEITDVVVVDPDNDESVVRSFKPYDTSVAGILSTTPSPLGREVDPETKQLLPLKENYLPIALASRVPCKATTENGPIKRGDLLVTSSKPGHAMKADVDKLKPGMLVDKALEPLEKGDGTILVFTKGC